MKKILFVFVFIFNFLFAQNIEKEVKKIIIDYFTVSNIHNSLLLSDFYADTADFFLAKNVSKEKIRFMALQYYSHYKDEVNILHEQTIDIRKKENGDIYLECICLYKKNKYEQGKNVIYVFLLNDKKKIKSLYCF